MKRIMILGATGMLGNTLLRCMARDSRWDVQATARMSASRIAALLPAALAERVREGVSADNQDSILRAFAAIRPDVVINCIGLIKQDPWSLDPLSAIQVNSLLPHRISMICRAAGARLIHISTDCVFSGQKGRYRESDPCDANDLYGRSKLLGEVDYPPHCLTLRTSIIGHELKGFRGLVEWFRQQQRVVDGYHRAVFSGLPSIELCRVISDFVLPNPSLAGVYHVSAAPISKMALLELIATQYKHPVRIQASEKVAIDRSMDSHRFREATGYRPPDWPELVTAMHRDYETYRELFEAARSGKGMSFHGLPG